MADWVVRISAAAQRDFSSIVEDSERRFGPHQARRYGTLLVDALVNLRSGPDVLGSVARADVGPGLRTFPIARRGRRGRHILLYRAAGPNDIEILRILHDRMDVARHLPRDPP